MTAKTARKTELEPATKNSNAICELYFKKKFVMRYFNDRQNQLLYLCNFSDPRRIFHKKKASQPATILYLDQGLESHLSYHDEQKNSEK